MNLAVISRAADKMRGYRQKETGARDELRQAVRDAVDAGVPVSHIAKAAGWSQRASVYNLLREGQ
jgi:molybdate-binding protein